MTRIEFTAYGEAKPAGSKRAFGFKRKNGTIGVNVTDDCEKTKSWQFVVSTAAALAMVDEGLMVENAGAVGTTFLQGALSVNFHFFFPRPKGHFGSGTKSNVMKPAAPSFHTKKPDALKLARAVEDAMTGIVYRDDAQIVMEHITKSYGEPARVEIKINTLD